MYDTWFFQHSANSQLDNLTNIGFTMLEGGWYRADLIPGKLTLLSFNSLQMNSSSVVRDLTGEEDTELDWLEAQLVNAAPGEKFLVQMHIYETAGLWNGVGWANWKKDRHLERYLRLMNVHADKILLEVTGHDHLAGMRYSAKHDGFYLNKVLFPGLTGSSQTQPGFGTFEFDSETDTVQALKFTFIDIDSTIGLPETTPFDELPWF